MPKKRTRQRLYAKLPALKTLPKVALMPRQPRGPRVLQPWTKPAEVRSSDVPPPPPANFEGTLPEWQVYWWLVRHDFQPDFQSSLMGGRMRLGGMVADFILHEIVPPLVLRVQGLHWHYDLGAQVQKNQMQKDQLMNLGFRVIDLDEDDIYTRLNYVMRLAVYEDIDISRAEWVR